jgi:lipid-A-disaccharide synthase-like uncharacterized protein
MNREQKFDMAGYVGIALIQGATFPSMIAYLINGEGRLPPLSMTAMIWAGLALFLARSIDRKDTVAIISNAIGWILQSVMLALITLPLF